MRQETIKQEILQPVDILVCLKLSIPENTKKGFESLGRETGIASSTLHRAVTRAQDAGLLRKNRELYSSRLINFLRFGIKHTFYVKRGEVTRGLATAHAAPPLNKLMNPSSEYPVWPYAQGESRGYAISPLHPDVPIAASKDHKLYELLALVDAVRVGNVREYNLAMELLEDRIA